MPKFSAYMRGEGTKGDTGEAAGFGNITASVTTSLPYGSTPQVSVEKSGENTELNLDFQFGLVGGEAAGFSTNQKSNIEFISVTSNPSVSITTDNTSPNNSKVFNFDFKIPEPLGISEITAVTTTTSEGINEITIWYNNGTTTSFNISNGAQGETGFIEGEVATTTELPTQGNHIGRGFLVGQEGAKHLFVYLNDEWTDQGLILGAGFGEPTSSAESIPATSLSTASGSLVHITDAAAIPIESLTVEIEPVQGGSGTPAPDNVRPISGHATATVTRTGVNLFDKSQLSSNTMVRVDQIEDGFTLTQLTQRTYAQKAIFLNISGLDGKTLYVKGNITNSGGNDGRLSVRFEDANKNELTTSAQRADISNSTPNNHKTVPNGTKILEFVCYSSYANTGNVNDVATFKDIIVSVEDDAYQPYTAQTVTIDLDGTRYGGTVDVKTGVMTVDRAMVAMGTLDWTYSSNRMKSVLNDIKPCESTVVPNLTAEQYRAIKWSAGLSSNHDGIALNPTAVGTGYEVVVYATDSSNTPSGKLVYPLASPFTVQLTPAELSLLYGTNNVWANTGDIEVTYAKMNEPSVEVTVDPESPESAKIFDFNFKIPQGEKGDKGDIPVLGIITSASTLQSNEQPRVIVDTISDNNFNFKFGIPEAKTPQMQASVSTVEKLPSLSNAEAEVILEDKHFKFNFGLPQGIQGETGNGISRITFNGFDISTSSNYYTINYTNGNTDSFSTLQGIQGIQGETGLGFYQQLPISANNSAIWEENNGAFTLKIDRTENENIPVGIYNDTNKIIAATFIIAQSTNSHPYGTIEYNTLEKFDGILYYIGKAPTPEVVNFPNIEIDPDIRIVQVNENPSVQNIGTNTNPVLKFILPPSSLIFTAGTTDVPSTLTEGTFYFQYEEEE